MLRVFYGGSFDPVHNGHLAVARAVRDALQAEVFLLPARDPPHKDATHADARQRATMLELAIEGEPGLAVDRRELRRPGPSYTIDTLAELRAELGMEVPIAWLVGGDSLMQLHTWRRWRELFDLAHIVAVRRPGAEADDARLLAEAPEVFAETAPRRRDAESLASAPHGGFALVEMAGLRPESSTELRRRIRTGQDWGGWVPPPVAAFIETHGLYRAMAILPPLP